MFKHLQVYIDQNLYKNAKPVLESQFKGVYRIVIKKKLSPQGKLPFSFKLSRIPNTVKIWYGGLRRNHKAVQFFCFKQSLLNVNVWDVSFYRKGGDRDYHFSRVSRNREEERVSNFKLGETDSTSAYFLLLGTGE